MILEFFVTLFGLVALGAALFVFGPVLHWYSLETLQAINGGLLLFVVLAVAMRWFRE